MKNKIENHLPMITLGTLLVYWLVAVVLMPMFAQGSPVKATKEVPAPRPMQTTSCTPTPTPTQPPAE